MKPRLKTDRFSTKGAPPSTAITQESAISKLPLLSEGEEEVLYLMCVEGRTNKEIANFRGISVSRVNQIEERLRLKFAASNGKQLAYRARKWIEIICERKERMP